MSDPAIPQFDENEAVPAITHGRDLVVTELGWEQDYNFLDYNFAPHPFWARHYLDEDGVVILHDHADGGGTLARVPKPVLAYLQYRFDKIDILCEETARTRLWERPEA